MKISKKILSIILCLTLMLSTLCMGMSVNATTSSASSIQNKNCPNCSVRLAIHYHPETCTTDGYYEYVCTNIACKGYSEFVAIAKHAHGELYGTVSDVTTLAPTCTTAGVKETFCKECGNVISASAIAATGHTASVWVVTQEPTATTAGEKVKYCTTCGTVMQTESIAKHTHTAGDTVIVRAASCTQTGVSGTMCKECSAVYTTASIAATGHSEPVYATNVPATCTTKGEDNGYCTSCGEIIATKETDVLGHDDGVVLTTTSATCTTEGESSTVCTRCGETIATASIDALGHDDGVETISIQPTCELAGESVTTCTRCGDVIASSEIAALGHDDGYWVVEYEATPEHDGRMNRFCSRCNMILETKEFTRHTHSKGYEEVITPATCTQEGQLGIFCASCGVCYEITVIAPIGHNYGPWYMSFNNTHSSSCDQCGDIKTENCTFVAVATAATCTSYGYTTNTCSVCSFSYVDKIVAPLGHDWSDWIDNQDGVTHTRTCLRTDCTENCCEANCEGGCKASETDIHVWSKWSFNNDNKLFKNGTMTRHCVLCGATQTVTCEKSSKIALTFIKIINTLRSAFGLKVITVVTPGDGDVVIVDSDSTIDSDIGDSNSDSDLSWIS